MSIINSFGKSNEKEKTNHKDIIKEIEETGKMIDFTNAWFADEKDSDLINSCIYQRESLISKYNYLINKAKKENIKYNPK